jgi:hypothetical protein
VRISAPGYKTKGQMPQQNWGLDTVSGTLVNVATFKCGPRIATLKAECAWDSGGFQIKSPWRFSARDKLSQVQAVANGCTTKRITAHHGSWLPGLDMKQVNANDL